VTNKICRKCKRAHGSKKISMVCAEVVDEEQHVVNTELYTTRCIDRSFRYNFEVSVYVCESCLQLKKHRWCGEAILSFIVVMSGFLIPALSSAQTVGDEPFAVAALRAAGVFGGTFVLLLSLSRLSGFIGRGFKTEVAMPFLRDEIRKHQTNPKASVALFKHADWDLMRQNRRSTVDPDDDFHFALIFLGTLVIPFAISFIFESLGIVSWGLL